MNEWAPSAGGLWSDNDQNEMIAALNSFDWRRSAQLCDYFVAQLDHLRPSDALEAEERGWRLLRLLHGRRLLTETRNVAEALFEANVDSVRIRHRYVLTLLDDGKLVAAEKVLKEFTDEERASNGEVGGALGRLYKDRYLKQPRSQTAVADLARAIRTYLDFYEADPSNYYHGVNAVALLSLAACDAVELEGHPDPGLQARALASAILTTIAETQEPDRWALATAVELCIALGAEEDARARLESYLETNPDAFEINSLLRQLRTLWRLETREGLGRVIVDLLSEELLKRTRSVVQIEQVDAPAAVSERVGYQPASL